MTLIDVLLCEYHVGLRELNEYWTLDQALEQLSVIHRRRMAQAAALGGSERTTEKTLTQRELFEGDFSKG